MRATWFSSLMLPGQAFAGYSEHTLNWGEYTLPYFNWEQAKVVQAAFQEIGADLRYDADRDVFVLYEDDVPAPDHAGCYYRIIIGEQRFYQLGNMWHEEVTLR